MTHHATSKSIEWGFQLMIGCQSCQDLPTSKKRPTPTMR